MGREDHASIDETFTLVGNRRQRLVIQYFKQHANPVALADLAARVARWERDATEPSADEVNRVCASLHETHLPKLVELGLIDYDLDAQTIRYDPAAIAASVENAGSVMDFLWRTEEAEEAEETEKNVYRTTHDMTQHGLSVTIAQALAEVKDVNAAEMIDDFSRYVDTDALDTLFRTRRNGKTRQDSGFVHLEIDGADVTVDVHGEIEIKP